MIIIDNTIRFIKNLNFYYNIIYYNSVDGRF